MKISPVTIEEIKHYLKAKKKKQKNQTNKQHPPNKATEQGSFTEELFQTFMEYNI